MSITRIFPGIPTIATTLRSTTKHHWYGSILSKKSSSLYRRYGCSYTCSDLEKQSVECMAKSRDHQPTNYSFCCKSFSESLVMTFRTYRFSGIHETDYIFNCHYFRPHLYKTNYIYIRLSLTSNSRHIHPLHGSLLEHPKVMDEFDENHIPIST